MISLCSVGFFQTSLESKELTKFYFGQSGTLNRQNIFLKLQRHFDSAQKLLQFDLRPAIKTMKVVNKNSRVSLRKSYCSFFFKTSLKNWLKNLKILEKK